MPIRHFARYIRRLDLSSSQDREDKILYKNGSGDFARAVFFILHCFGLVRKYDFYSDKSKPNTYSKNLMELV